MRHITLLSILLSIPIFSSCSTHGKIRFDSDYWERIQKNGYYKTVQSSGVSTDSDLLHRYTGPDQDRWDIVLHRRQHSRQRVPNIPPGTIIQARYVYLDTVALQSSSISYSGLIIGGEYDGSRVVFTELLGRDGYGFYPDPEYLVQIAPPDEQPEAEPQR